MSHTSPSSTSTLPAPQPHAVGPAAVIGLGTAAAMWTGAFLSHVPGLALPPAAVGVGLLIVQLAGMALGVRSDGRVRVGLAAGLVCGLANLLVVGSLLSEKAAPGLEGLREHAWAYAAGWLGLSVFLGDLGAVAGRALRVRSQASPPAAVWLFRMGVVAAGALVPLLLIGGLVTSTRSGMAVPDWPTSFSANMFLYPLKAMTGGIYYEHAHRLFGALAGLIVLALTLHVWLIDRRGWVRGVATAIFAAVCVQGIIGGLRVNSNSTLLAMLHGVSGQLIFAAACGLAATLAPGFIAAGTAADDLPRVRGVGGALLACTVVQLCFGAATRHFPPPERGWHSVGSHIVFALVVVVLAVIVSARGKRLKGTPGPAGTVLARFAAGIMHAVGLQFVLGFAALWAVLVYGKSDPAHPADVALTTLHQFNGAAVLGLSTLVWVWSRRLNR